jgi:hypothetical protein
MPHPSLCGPMSPPCRENSSSEKWTFVGALLDIAKSSHICCALWTSGESHSMRATGGWASQTWDRLRKRVAAKCASSKIQWSGQ